MMVASFFLLTSCASFIDNMQKELGRQEKSYSGESQTADLDQFSHYRKNTKRRTSSVYNQPGRNKDVSTTSLRNVSPSVKRQYRDERTTQKRATASDFTDQGNDGSLWGNSDGEHFLFSSNRNKTSGDIIQINVLSRLKNDITLELKRAFPDNPYEARAKAEADKRAAETQQTTAGQENANAQTNATMATDNSSDSSLYDKISSVVVEEINREHLLIKGRKNVLYKNRKRMIEVQALVSRRDISEDDSISSDSILESNVSVVR